MKILLFTPNFFDYPVQICNELRKMGHEVDWFDDRPSTNSLVKAIIRIKRNLIDHMIKNYFQTIIRTISTKKYEKVIVISGQSLSFTEEMIIELKNKQSQAEFILYQWDSVRNFSYIESLQQYFDRCYSFDSEDVKNNSDINFLPLFYCRKYEQIGEKANDNFKYDLMFVGTAHPQKYKFVKEMAQKLECIYNRQFIYFFFPSRLVYFYRKLINPELKNASYSEFNYTPINEEKMIQLLSESRCVLDSAQAGQTGLTIRVLECLGAKKKIITTNADVINYDFYKEENIYIYDGKFNLESPFFTKHYQEISNDIYIKYSLRSWLSVLLEGDK